MIVGFSIQRGIISNNSRKIEANNNMEASKARNIEHAN